MVKNLAGLVVLGAFGWGAVVLVLCGVQLAGETVAWVANGGLGRLPGWSWPLISAGVLGLVGVAWFRWVWPDEVGEEVDCRLSQSHGWEEARWRVVQRERQRRGEAPVGPLCPWCGCCVPAVPPEASAPNPGGSKSVCGSVGGPDIGGV